MSFKVLILPDRPHWALDKNADDLIKYNNSNIILEKMYFADFMPNAHKLVKEYDIVYPIYIGNFFDMLKAKVDVSNVVTGIRSYHRWDKGKTMPPGYSTNPSKKIIKQLKKALLVNTNCKKLWYVFSSYLKVVHTKYACDLNSFYPEKKQKNKNLVVGWCGSLKNHGKKRGFYEFIEPACNSVEGIELKLQTAENNLTTNNDDLRNFYNSIDVYICASRTESGPRPVLEAAACGVASISSDVGIVPELIENNYNGVIVERNLDKYIKALAYAKSNKQKFIEMGKNARKTMENDFNWDKLIVQWLDFFRYAYQLKQLKQKGIIK